MRGGGGAGWRGREQRRARARPTACPHPPPPSPSSLPPRRPRARSADGHASFVGEDLSAKLGAFVKAEKLPAFIEFSSETSQDIFGSGINQQVGGPGGRVGGWADGWARRWVGRRVNSAAGCAM